MSYNIDTVFYISGSLGFTHAKWCKAVVIEKEKDTAEDTLLTDYAGGGPIQRPTWMGEGSGSTYETFLEILALTSGTAELLVCWEGGDEFGGIRVDKGKVTEHTVIFSLGEEQS